MKKINWGILSTAKIGLEKVIPAMQQGKHCEIVGNCFKNPGKCPGSRKTS